MKSIATGAVLHWTGAANLAVVRAFATSFNFSAVRHAKSSALPNPATPLFFLFQLPPSLPSTTLLPCGELNLPHLLLPQIPSLSQPPSSLITPQFSLLPATLYRAPPRSPSLVSAPQNPAPATRPNGRTAPIGRPPPAAKGMCNHSAPPSAPKGIVMAHLFSFCLPIPVPLSTT